MSSADLSDLSNVIFAAIVGLAAWFVKNVLLRSYEKRTAEIRKEWIYRLREIYCPLFFWSGVILFKSKTSDLKYGAEQLGKVLAISSHLVPQRHYHTLIRLIEYKLDQKTTPPDEESFRQLRAWIYSQIELHNFVLFKRNGYYEVEETFSITSGLKRLARLSISTAVNIFLWLAVALIVVAIYWAIAGKPIALIIIFALSGAIVVIELLRRRDFEMKVIQKTKNL